MNKKKIGIIASAIVLFIGAAGYLIWDNAFRFKGDGRHFINGRYYADFNYFNGKECFEYQLEKGEQIHLDAHLSKGKADFYFIRAGEKNGSSIKGFADADTDYTAEETGRYEVKIKVKHAKGTIEVKCDDNVKDKTIYR